MLYLLAVLCPPAAVLFTGKPGQAAANVGLTLLLYFPGLAHALSVVGQYRVQRRNETLTRLVTTYYARPSHSSPGWGYRTRGTPR
jgi:uncharacterized membrane protein YqaE (UPF0057 family)